MWGRNITHQWQGPRPTSCMYYWKDIKCCFNIKFQANKVYQLLCFLIYLLFFIFFLLLANCLLPCKALHEQNVVGHVLSTHTHSSSILHRNLFFCAVLFAVLVIKADFRQNSAKPELEIMSLGMWLYGREQRVGGIFICLPSPNCYCALLLLEVLW